MSDRRVALGALALLVALDLVLVFLALRPAPTPAAAPVTPAPPAASAPTEPTEGTGFPPVVATDPLPRALLVGVGGDGSIFASTVADCDATDRSIGGALPVGATSATPAATAGAKELRLGALPNGALYSVAASQGCADASFQVAERQLGTWDAAIPPTGVTYLVPSTSGDKVVLKDGQTLDVPCKALSLAVTTTEDPRVLCSDGSIQRYGLDGWSIGGAVPQPRALVAGTGGTLYALHLAEGCYGMGVSISPDDGTSWSPTPCVTGVDSSGSVGIGFSGDTLVVIDSLGKAFRSTSAAQAFTSGS